MRETVRLEPWLALALLAIAACGGRTSGTSPGSDTGEQTGSGAGTGASAGAGTGTASTPSAGTSGGGGTGTTSGSSTGASGSTLAPSPCGVGASTIPVSFTNELMPIFQNNCSVGGTGPNALCHGDPSVSMALVAGGTRQWFGPPAPASNSSATLTMIYNGFVNQPSTEDTHIDIVKPGDPTQSFLWYKINNTQGSLDAETPDQCGRGDLGNCGPPMSLSLLSGSSTTLLPQADLDLICNWILQGAQNDSSPCPAGQAETQSGTCAPCPSGEALCAGRCVNEETDGNNCGSCSIICGEASCQSGACVCPIAGQTACGGFCVDEQTDPDNCGACGKGCSADAACESGICGPCSVGQTACFGACVNEQTDLNNCGGCDTPCPAGASCQAGVCACPNGETACAGSCVNEQNDPDNCGACRMWCPTGVSCQGGTCACPSGQTACKGTCPPGGFCRDICVDEQTDPRNCGACGTQCFAATGPSCQKGSCACPGGETVCNGACVNEQTDAYNCGECGNRCATDAGDMICVGGVCAPN